jgi:ABC-type spermidine/putrescine transport system permease subunit II
LKALTAVVYLLMLLPLVLVVINSFNPSRFLEFPPTSLTLQWYQEFVNDDIMLGALWNSVKVATGAAIGCGVIGTLTSMGYVRKQFPAKNGVTIVMLTPRIVPPIIIGVAAAIFFSFIGIDRSIWWLITMHIVIGLPYAFLIVRSQLYLFDESLEEAAQTLGADRLTTFREVTLPLIFPTVVIAMVIVFVISFGEFTATQFWVSRSTRTIPVVIFSAVKTNITPKVDVMATVVLATTITLALLAVGIRRSLQAA